MAISIYPLAEFYKDSLTRPNEVYAQQVLRRLCVICLITELQFIHEYVAECESPQMWFDPQTVADGIGRDVGFVERGMAEICRHGLFVRKPSHIEGFAWVYQTDVEYRRNQLYPCALCGEPITPDSADHHMLHVHHHEVK